MKKNKPAKQRSKLNFAVDRDEFEISSDWVQAVMARPAAVPEQSPDIFVPVQNTATVEQDAAVAENSTAHNNTASQDMQAVSPSSDFPATVESSPSKSATVANNIPVVNIATDVKNDTDKNNAAVVNNTPVASSATVAIFAIKRTYKLRPIRRITDGLTPGQYAVYSLMYDHADPEPGSTKLYRGGYADLGRLTGLSKRGIQNVVAELQQKNVIELHVSPGHHKNQTSVYRVPSPEAVVAAWHGRGWCFAVGKSKILKNTATVEKFTTVA